MGELLTVKEYATQFNLTEGQVRYRITKDRLETRKVGGIIYIVATENCNDVSEEEVKVFDRKEDWVGLANLTEEVPAPEDTEFTEELHDMACGELLTDVGDEPDLGLDVVQSPESLNSNLATIQEIKELFPIEGRDRIELAKVLDWQVIVGKGEFEVGDYCVFIEIDTVVPAISQFSFMEKYHYRVKTMRMGGVQSQGLALPVTILNELLFAVDGDAGKNEEIALFVDDDVTELIGVVKHEKKLPSDMRGTVRGTFPHFIPKTDESRIQSRGRWINDYRGHGFVFTEKLNGTSATYYLNKGVFGACSRNLDLMDSPSNLYWKIARGYEIETKLRNSRFKELSSNIAIQGEIVGQSIAKNPYKLEGQHFFVFQVYVIDEYRYLDSEDFFHFCSSMGFERVPNIFLNRPIKDSDTVESLVSLAATIKSRLNPDILVEGLVARPLIERKDYRHNRVSFKIKVGD